MNDPLSPLTAPPPRYLLESDSSDEEGQGTYPGAAPGPSKPKIRINEGVKVDITGLEGEVEEVVIGLGQAGRYLSKSVQGEMIGGVKVGSSSVGVVYKVGKGRVILVEEGDLNGNECWEVVKSLVGKVKAGKWTVVSSYVPSMYIPSPSERTGRLDNPPIRVLSTSTIEGTKGFDSPNYLTGVAGGLVSLASHPTSSIPIPTVLLLPLPLSALSFPQVQSSLKSISPDISSTFGQSSKRWTEDDDEPYSAPGMGRVRGLRKGVAEVSSMYM
ncbi:hypothetical protein I302_108132 [Kwoniella bestiolae CBS 10118]|uniref:Uncharacterized protein n=1 Tax=Kwoniella bestiolae CBS 10118 TaxID=1296100 RepID=A0A1B9FWK6_9TREE|nr:hypothetical protein I302_07502 [Kwoniella bestiolae CBS 10118]OCF23149.1 hypothetical protein I302_07502 [Kwoniella bestiolae CBS 10118]